MIKAVIFDCFGVLTTDHWREFLHSQPEDISLRLHALNGDLDSSKISRDDFFREASKLTGLAADELSEAMAPVDQKNRALLNYIHELRRRKLTIGLISNVGNNWIRKDFLDAEEASLFDDMVMSFEVNMVKPNPEIYKLALQRLDVTAAQGVFIDDVPEYCAAAETVGMLSILYHDFLQMQQELEQLLNQSE